VAVACDMPPIKRVKRRDRSLGGRNRHGRKGRSKNWKGRFFNRVIYYIYYSRSMILLD
jgi:hypothetical protein